MAFKTPTGTRRPMSQEARARIAEAMRRSAAKRRGESPDAPSPDRIGEDLLKINKPLELVKMRDQNFSPDLFIPMKTGKPVDFLFTEEGGIPKACNFMLIGDPGVGKSTVSLDILSDLAISGHKVLFISAEMSRIDLYGYVQRYPKFGEVDILFTGEYCDANPKAVIEEALKPGYDVVLIDSFVEVQDDIKEAMKISSNGAEKWMIDTMLEHNLGNNDSKTNTTFIAIQQVTKGGVFVGSNRLKHNTTGMLELRFEEGGISQYMIFVKNRRGSVQKRMFFSLSSTGDVEYDISRFKNDEMARESAENERLLIRNEGQTFDAMFGLEKKDVELEEML